MSSLSANAQAENHPLESLHGVEVVVKRDPETSFVTAFNVVDGAISQPDNDAVSNEAAPDDPEVIARGFLHDYGNDFGLQGSALELLQPERLTPASFSRRGPSVTAKPAAEIDRSGTDQQVNSVRFTQRKNGLPVYGSGVVVRLDDNSDVIGGSMRVSTVDSRSRQITVSESSATNRARKLVTAIGQPSSVKTISEADVELVIFNPYLLGAGRNVERPAWHIRLQIGASPERDSEVFIDAGNGNVLMLEGLADGGLGAPAGPDQEQPEQTPLLPLNPSNGAEINEVDTFPVFRWKAHDDAAGYVLLVTRSDKPDGDPIEIRISEPRFHCSASADSICSATVPGQMVDGAQYNWWVGKRVRAQNSGVVQWSEMQSFIYAHRKLPPAAMQESDLLSPLGEQGDAINDQQFYWHNPGASDWFRLLVTDQTTGQRTSPGLWISATDAGCSPASGPDSGICTAIHHGYQRSDVKKYCWSVTSWNELGLGNPSPQRCFSESP